jgi:hypothetical protein
MFVSQIYDEIAEILGTTDNTKIFRKLTQAVQTLMESGHWFHTNAEVDVCTGWDGVTVTLPRNVEIPLAVNVDGSPMYFRDRLFQYHVNKGGMWNTVGWAWDDRGYQALQMDIVRPSQLIAVAESTNDAGKFLRVLGTDRWNRTLRSQLNDGTGVDGLLIPIHSQSDFQLGTITPDGNTVNTRNVAVTPMTTFTTTTPHYLTTTAPMQLSAVAGTIPIPLSDGVTYYVGVLDAYTIQLFSDPLNAASAEYPLKLRDISGYSHLQLVQNIPSQVITSLVLSSAPPIALNIGNEIVFPAVNTALPSPLATNVTYFANQLDRTHLQIFSSLADAQNNTNPINTTGSTAAISVDLRKAFTPNTKLTFTVNHYFASGDQVQAVNAGGSLPQPLLSNQNYYVGVVAPIGDAKTVTLHLTAADALAGTNPINFLSSGSGQNSLVKLVPASAQLGSINNMVVTGTNFTAATGTGASATACVSGPITNVTVGSAGGGYVNAPIITIDDTGGAGYATSGTTVSFVGACTTTAQATAVVDAGTGQITGIQVTNGGTGYGTPPDVYISGAGKGAVAIATITSGSVPTGLNTGVTLQPVGKGAGITVNIGTVTGTGGNVGTMLPPASFSPGSGYEIVPRVTIKDASGGSGATPGAITLTSQTVTAIAVANGGSNYASVPSVLINGGNGTGATAHAVLTNGVVTSIVMDNVGSGYTSTPTVWIGGSGASFNLTLTTNFVSRYILTNLTAGGSGNSGGTGSDYGYTPTVTITGGVGTGATALATVDPVSKRVVSITPVTQGNGYIATPSVVITPQTGNFIQFTSTGSLPSPLLQGSSYLIGSPALVAGSQTFSVLNADGSAINITSLGSGNLYVAISRTFATGWTGYWTGDFSGLVTGQQFYFGSDYLLPSGSVGQGSASIDNGVTPFYLNITQTSGQLTEARVYDTQAHANAGGSTGLVTITGFGTGQTYYSLRYTSQSLPYNNAITPETVKYLKDGQIVSFSTTATLPSPLAAGIDYVVQVTNNYFKVYTTGGNLITLTTPGSGQLLTNVIRDVVPVAATTITAEASLYETGVEVVPRASVGDVLPNGLTAGTSYFVRRKTNNSFELYDTSAHALDTTSTTGRISYTTVGNTLDSTFYVDSLEGITFVKSVSQVDKPITDGYVSLYAYDYGRDNDMTLIGQYHPTETNPQYRRIRIGKSCAWARILYRVQAPTITSIYDYIPLENARAVITAVHAADLEDKDFAEQATRYWALAYKYLSNQQEALAGHAMQAIQVNNLTYGDKTDPVIEGSGYW